MRHHTSLSPSSAPALMQCACYKSGGGDVPDSGDGYDSAGNEIHALTESIIMGRKLPETTLLGDKQKERCEHGAEEIKTFIKSIDSSLTIQDEVKISIYNRMGKEISYGHADLVAMPKVGLDIKSGFDFKPNLHDYKPQQVFYAMGLMQKHNLDKLQWGEYYIMPGKLKPYELTYNECAAMIEAVHRRQNAKEKHPQICYFCRNCNNLLKCGAVNKSLKMLNLAYADLERPENIKGAKDIIDPDEMCRLLIFAKDILKPYSERIKKMAVYLEKSALDLNEKGVDIPYFKRVGKSKNFVDDLGGAFKAVPELTSSEFQGTLKLSLPDLAEVVWKKLKAMGEKKAQKDVRKNLEGRFFANGLLKSTETKYSLERIIE